MNWLNRLNAAPRALPIEGAAIEVVHWAHSPALPSNVPHRHTFFEVCLVGDRGTGTFHEGGESHRVSSASLFHARPGAVHQIDNIAGATMELYWVSFTLPAPPNAPKAPLLAAWSAGSVPHCPAQNLTLRLWQNLREIAGAPESTATAAQITALQTALLLNVVQAALTPAAQSRLHSPAAPPPLSAHDSAARMAVRYIHDNLSSPLPWPEVAAHVHLSPRHLARLFTTFTGTAPSTYITLARLDWARHLLLNSAFSIKEIAATVGYSDVHYFARAFKQHSGRPPGEFRHSQPDQTGTGRTIRHPGDLV